MGQTETFEIGGKSSEFAKTMCIQIFYAFTEFNYLFLSYSLLNIKVFHDAIEEHFCLNGSIKNL